MARTRRPHAATTAAALVALALAPSAAAGGEARQKLAPTEARTKQALAQTAALLDARKVVVPECKLNGARARCEAIIRGPRQTLRATVAILELRDDYVIRVLRLR